MINIYTTKVTTPREWAGHVIIGDAVTLRGALEDPEMPSSLGHYYADGLLEIDVVRGELCGEPQEVVETPRDAWDALQRIIDSETIWTSLQEVRRYAHSATAFLLDGGADEWNPKASALKKPRWFKEAWDRAEEAMNISVPLGCMYTTTTTRDGTWIVEFGRGGAFRLPWDEIPGGER